MNDILARLISIPTVSGDQTAMHQLLNYVASFVVSRGMHVEWYESNGFESIVATTRGHRKTPKVLLAAHADVVPADEPAFTLTERDGRLYGRGAIDMKFAIAAYMDLIDSLVSNLDDYDFGLMITGDEELGGLNGAAKLVDEGYIPQVCILPDGGDDWQIQTSSKGFWAFEISTTGRSAHGSRHWQGDNAITKLLATLEEITGLFEDPSRQSKDTNTVSLNLLNGGVAMNQVPESASMTIDVRTTDAAEHARIYEAVTAICRRHGAAYRHVSDCAPTSFDLQDPLIAPFARLIAERTGVAQNGYHALGSSDARFYVPFGVPCISVYPTGGNLHAEDEWIDAEAFQHFRAILGDYMEQIARTDGMSPPQV